MRSEKSGFGGIIEIEIETRLLYSFADFPAKTVALLFNLL